MARSQQSFAKRQKELKRKKRKEDKARRKEERTSTGGSGDLSSMMAYVDEFGQLTTLSPEEREAAAKAAAIKQAELAKAALIRQAEIARSKGEK